MDFLLGAGVFFVGVVVGAGIARAGVSAVRPVRTKPPNGKDQS